MFERYLNAVPPVQLTAQGTSQGKITVSSTKGFKAKQQAVIIHPTLGQIGVQIKRVTSRYTMLIGLPNTPIDKYTDASAYGTTCSIFAKAQDRPVIPLQEINRAVYEEEPTVAVRTINVDEYGNPYDLDNPLPIVFDGTVQIGDVEIKGPSGNYLDPNANGSINVVIVNANTNGITIYTNEVSSVPSGSETNVYTQTVGPNGLVIYKLDLSGDTVGTFRVKVDGVVIATRRLYWGNFNQDVVFDNVQNGLKLNPNQILSITILHGRPDPGTFEASVFTQT